MLTSELFALAHGTTCQGPHACHWCGAPCDRRWRHEEPPPIPFTRVLRTARRPQEPFICVGCWLWRRNSVTVRFISEGFKDRSTPASYSWWITPLEALAIRLDVIADKVATMQKLLSPIKTFALMLQHDGPILLQGGSANHLPTAPTPQTTLTFTVGTVVHRYSIYELEEALSTKSLPGKEAGVRVLVDLLGPYVLPPKAEHDPTEKRGRGRPANKVK